MKGDFSRDTFNRAKHFSRVLMQQGRVTLDADFNEQSAILLHYLRTLARDLIGPYAAPVENAGFVLRYDENDGRRSLTIGAGRYYVDGILVENDEECAYQEQPDYSLGEDDPVLEGLRDNANQAFWFYLDVWERHVSALEDDSIRESALGGPDTCARAKVVWQVRALPVDLPRSGRMACDAPLAGLVRISAASMAARMDPGQKTEDPCITPPDSKYRGTENQLYRVEIHHGGEAGEATFKWSRDNGSVETAWLGTEGENLKVGSTRGFGAGDWVELSDRTHDLQGTVGSLVRLVNVDGEVLAMDPDPPAGEGAPPWTAQLKNPRVRRWNQTQIGDIVLKAGAVPVSGPTEESDGWIDLEDGVQIRFSSGGIYRSGDYWLIPARVATGKLEWPVTDDAGADAILQPPHGVEHHYAPLGFFSGSGEGRAFRSCPCDFEPLSSCFEPGSAAVGARLLNTAEPVGSTPTPAPTRRPTTTTRRRRTPSPPNP